MAKRAKVRSSVRKARGRSVVNKIESLRRIAQELAEMEAGRRAADIAWLNGLRNLSSKAQAQAIDKGLLEELAELLEKLKRISPGQAPGPDQQWAILEELIRLILKLIFKVFVLQGGFPPPIDPRI
jgi:hypothetical protein